MYFGLKKTSRERAARLERQDLVLLSQEMEARHKEVLRALKLSPGKTQDPAPEVTS
jgi:hypothetical protein